MRMPGRDDVERFLFREAGLLDRGEYDAWLTNFGDNPLEYFTQYKVRFAENRRRHVAWQLENLPGQIDSLRKRIAANEKTPVGEEPLAKQLAEKGIRVNGVAPGPIWTPLQVSGGAKMEKLKKFGGQTPLGRPGQPAELASIYVQLAANDASYATGQVYGAAGGSGQP